MVANTKKKPVVDLPEEGESIEVSAKLPKNPVKTTKREETALLVSLKKGVVRLALGALVPLEKTTIKDAKTAMRSVNKKHLASLLTASENEIPPIIVQNTTDGFVIVDGYHRYARAIRLARRQFLAQSRPHMIDPESGQPSEELAGIESDKPQEENAFIARQTIRAETVNCASIFELLNMAYTANFKHGLPASESSRSRYGFWLFTELANAGTPISIREAGRRSGVSHVAIQHYRDAKVRETEKMEDGETTDDLPQDEQKALDLATRRASTLANAVKAVWKDLQDDNIADAARFLGTRFKLEVDGAAILGVANILNAVADLVPEDETGN